MAQGFGGFRTTGLARAIVQLPNFWIILTACSYSFSVGPCGPLIDLRGSLALGEPLGAQCSMKTFKFLKFLRNSTLIVDIGVDDPLGALGEPWGALGTPGNLADSQVNAPESPFGTPREPLRARETSETPSGTSLEALGEPWGALGTLSGCIGLIGILRTLLKFGTFRTFQVLSNAFLGTPREPLGTFEICRTLLLSPGTPQGALGTFERHFGFSLLDRHAKSAKKRIFANQRIDHLWDCDLTCKDTGITTVIDTLVSVLLSSDSADLLVPQLLLSKHDNRTLFCLEVTDVLDATYLYLFDALTHTCACARAHAHACSCAHAHPRTHACAVTHAHVYACSCTDTHARTRIHTCACTHTRVHAYTHIHAHTHTHVHLGRGGGWSLWCSHCCRYFARLSARFLLRACSPGFLPWLRASFSACVPCAALLAACSFRVWLLLSLSAALLAASAVCMCLSASVSLLAALLAAIRVCALSVSCLSLMLCVCVLPVL